MKKLILATAISGAVLAGNAMAADTDTAGKIQFQGKVVEQTCQVQTPSKNQIVVLETVPKTRLAAAGNTAMPTPFHIDLSNCTVGNPGVGLNGTKVKAHFSEGNNVETQFFTLKNQIGNDMATNVNIQLFDKTGTTPITPSKQTVSTEATGETKYSPADSANDIEWTDVNSATPTLNYVAKYYATGAATAGNVRTSVNFELTYK